MNNKLMSVIGSAALLTSTFSLAQTPAEAPPAAPAPAAPAAPATPPPAAPAPTVTTTPPAPAAPAPTKADKLATKLANKLAKLTAAVGLTADQQPKVMAIYQDEEKQKAANPTKIHAVRDAADAQIVALLTPDQNAKYTAYKTHKQ